MGPSTTAPDTAPNAASPARSWAIAAEDISAKATTRPGIIFFISRSPLVGTTDTKYPPLGPPAPESPTIVTRIGRNFRSCSKCDARPSRPGRWTKLPQPVSPRAGTAHRVPAAPGGSGGRGYDAADHHGRQRPLHLGPGASRYCHRNDAERRHQRGHQHRSKPRIAASVTASMIGEPAAIYLDRPLPIPGPVVSSACRHSPDTLSRLACRQVRVWPDP